MRCRPASQRYTDGIESGIGAVAQHLVGTGEKLQETAAIVENTDNEDVRLFTRFGGAR